MPWRETSVEDVRYNFILAQENRQGSVIEICDAFGISRKTGYKWLKRYQAEGKEGLTDKRRSPINRPRDTPPELIAAILAVRWTYPH